MALETIVSLFIISVFVAGLTDLLFNPISILYKSFWQYVQKMMFKIGKQSYTFLPYVWITCPYCFSLWISFFTCMTIFPNLTLPLYILYGIICWYMAYFYKLIIDVLIKIKIYAFSSIEE